MMIIGQKKVFLGARVLWGLSLLLVFIVIAGGPGVHLGLWSPLDGFIISMKGGFLGGLAIAGLSIVMVLFLAFRKKYSGTGLAILSLFVGLVLASPVGYLRLSGGGGVPPIHDITTDFAHPPEFKDLVGKRGEGANSLDYDATKLISIQQENYPDIVPLEVSETAGLSFDKALRVANDLGWDVTGADSKSFRFEATDYSFWFGFADDVVVIVQQTDSGSRIDLRSVSRVGISDLGVNAKRIRKFLEAYRATPK